MREGLAAAGDTAPVAVVALGSYGRAELCPGSDVDVLLVHGSRHDVAPLADALWYPLWDAGFVLGHAARTVRGALALADSDVHALTALLDGRSVAGDAALGGELLERARVLARRRSSRVVRELAEAADARRRSPGPVAEVLEPDLKAGSGGLRDGQALVWAGSALGDPGGLATLTTRGYLRPEDPAVLREARDLTLRVRSALHRVTGGRSDRLLLQEQDAVASTVGAPDAEAMVRDLAVAARRVAWISGDAWDRLQSTEQGPAGRVARRDRGIADGVVLRDGRVALPADTTVDTALVLRAAAAAATRSARFDRVTLERLRELATPQWDADSGAALVALLRTGRGSVAVFEALDHAGVLTRMLPEWEHVRSLPQRNAYHRYTVDRHLLEAVAECAQLLDEDDESYDGAVARRVARPELLLLGALLHDIGKGLPGDHSLVGAAMAREVGDRVGLDEGAVEVLAWLVEHHLLLADTATRRDLSEPSTIERFAATVTDLERLDLLYTLTVGDSRATGPAAWGPSKAALVRELHARTGGHLRGDELTWRPDVLVEHAARLDAGRIAVEWDRTSTGLWRCVVVAPDRRGMLATVASALALGGFDVANALARTRDDGMALEVFVGTDRYGRLNDEPGRRDVTATVVDALEGRLAVAERLAERATHYRRPEPPGTVEVVVDADASPTATVIEVVADDAMGLLALVATELAERGLDVSVAKVATYGPRVRDVFYVQGGDGRSLRDPRAVADLEASLVARLTTGSTT